MTNPAITVDQLQVAYGSQFALNDVSLQIFPGEILGLLGPNGAGKTTLLRAITGKLRPAAGSISIAGKALSPGKAYKHSIGFAPQSIGLYRHLTARENLEYFAQNTGVSRHQVPTRIRQVLEEIKLTDKADVRVDHLSGGMQRRIHLAATLVSHPALLVLDEPTAGVDLDVRLSIHDLIRNRAEQGAAVLIVTHELDEAEALSHRVALLHHGQLKALAEPQTLIKQTFGKSQIFVVRTHRMRCNDLDKRLQSIGFHLHNAQSNEWWLQSELPLDRLVDRLYSDLGEASESIAEVSVRRPGLRDVMQHYTGSPTNSAVEALS